MRESRLLGRIFPSKEERFVRRIERDSAYLQRESANVDLLTTYGLVNLRALRKLAGNVVKPDFVDTALRIQAERYRRSTTADVYRNQGVVFFARQALSRDLNSS